MDFTELMRNLRYFKELLEEAEDLSEKDREYMNYLKSLDKILKKADDFYSDDSDTSGSSQEELTRMFTQLNQQAQVYIQKHHNNTASEKMKKRLQAMSKLNQAIEKDVQNLANDAGGLGSFRPSPVIKIALPDTAKIKKVVYRNRVLIPVISPDGKKGFFVPKTDAGLSREWERIIADVKEKCPERLHGNLDALLKDYNKRQEILSNIKQLPTDSNLTDLAVKLGIAANAEEAAKMLEVAPNVKAALTVLVDKGSSLTEDIEFSKEGNLDSKSRTDNRRAAMYDVARVLGCADVVEKALPMEITCGDQKLSGTFIENPSGYDKQAATDVDFESSSLQGDLHRQLSDMKVVDYICGNFGRRQNNISYRLDNGKPPKIVGLQASENSRCFAVSPASDSLSSIREMDAKTAAALKKLDSKTLEDLLRKHELDEEEIEAACKRAKELQQQMTNTFNNFYIIDGAWGRHILYGKEKTDDMQDFLESLDKLGSALADLDDYNHGEYVSRDKEIVVADKKITKIADVLDKVGSAMDDGKYYSRMKESFDKVQKLSKEILDTMGSPDKKEEREKKHYEYEKELNIFKLHTAEYLGEQQQQLSKTEDDKATQAILKKIEVASTLQSKVQQLQEDMVAAFTAEMRAEVNRITRTASQAQRKKQDLQPEQQKAPEPNQQPAPQQEQAPPEMEAPEMDAPELGNRFQLRQK